MIENLEQIFTFYEYNLDNIYKYKKIEEFILNLFNNESEFDINNDINIEIIKKELNSECKLYWIGNYYKKNKNYKKMIEYYLLAIQMNNSDAMFQLGNYYRIIVSDFIEMEKYYLMAIEYKHSESMYYLGQYYCIANNLEKMEKYLLMAIDLKNTESMFILGFYYFSIKNYEKMEKYWLMAIEFKHLESMFNLAIYYKFVKSDVKLMEKYLLIYVQYDNLFDMSNQYKLIYYVMLLNVENKIELITNKIHEIEQNMVQNMVPYLFDFSFNKIKNEGFFK